MAALAIAGLAGCGATADAPLHSLAADSLEVSVLYTLRAAPAENVRGPGGAEFQVALRTPDLVQYPCASCHEPGRPARPAPDGTRAHANVEPRHPSALGAHCATCHSPSAPDQLVLQTGARVSLDQAYRLCAQCHFQQAEDWAMGAHGKRLGGWRGPRVIESCTGCHDPHAPAFEKRMPVGFPVIPRTSRLRGAREEH
jgi:hypothetical protein